MTGEFGAAADIATGALVGRAFEPRAGEGQSGRELCAHGALCLNCSTRLIGEHCHACGQSGHVHRSLGAIGHEIAHGVFHFEGKIWRTLPLLIFHPGTLTRRYVHGERARFVSPLALFLFTVFLMFATISAVGGEIAEGIGNGAPSAEARARMTEQIDKARAELAQNQTARAAAIKAGKATGEIDNEITALKATIAALDTVAGTKGENNFTFTDLKTGWPRLDKGIEKANANPGLTIYKLQSSAYKYSWALIPLSTPFVALLFLWRRRFHLYDHAIFVTYSLAFMMLLVIVLTIGGVLGLPASITSLAALFAPPIHMFAQLRGAYQLRKRSALWRTIALLLFAFLALTTFVILLLLHGLTE